MADDKGRHGEAGWERLQKPHRWSCRGITRHRCSHRDPGSSLTHQDQRVLLNTLGGRMPLGVRLTGSDHEAVSQRVSRLAERAMRRIETVAERLDSSIQ